MKRSRPALADLVDIELQLQADRDLDRDLVARRDAAIGQRLGAVADDRALFLGWIRELRAAAKTERSPGQQLRLFLEVVGLLLVLLGLVLGAGVVAGWLRYADGAPVNAIFLWSAVVGVQALLLLVWVLAVLPSAWLRKLPGAEAVQLLLRGIGKAVPLLVGWVAARMSQEHRLLVARVRGAAATWDWVYGRIRLWKLLQLTQLFAVAYNVGAIGALVAISYGDDPAFGWKSRRLTPAELHQVVEVLSAPWAWASPDATLSLAEVEVTQFTTLDPRFGATSMVRDASWGIWWPFLLASLLVYGLGPRILTLALSTWRLRRALDDVALDHGDLFKLRERLRRPLVDTRATSAPAAAPAPAATHALPHAVRDVEPATVLAWAGAGLAADAARELVTRRFGTPVAEVHAVGDVKAEGDRRALAALGANGARGQVMMVVESWEPPVGEYIDLVRAVRAAIGQGRMIVVLLHARDADGRPVRPSPLDERVWTDRMAAVGDPWLAVEALVPA